MPNLRGRILRLEKSVLRSHNPAVMREAIVGRVLESFSEPELLLTRNAALARQECRSVPPKNPSSRGDVRVRRGVFRSR